MNRCDVVVAVTVVVVANGNADDVYNDGDAFSGHIDKSSNAEVNSCHAVTVAAIVVAEDDDDDDDDGDDDDAEEEEQDDEVFV